MTDQRVRRLLWRGEAGWLLASFIGFIAIGMTIGYVSVQKNLDLTGGIGYGTMSFFQNNLQTPNNVELRSEIFASHYFYFLAILVGLLSAFWGRRTHYFEFMFNIGVTRKQIFKAQVLFSSLVVVIGSLLAETAEYSIIKWQYPAKDLGTFPTQIIIGQAFAAAGVSLLLFGLGMLIASLSDSFIFAMLLSLTLWRPFYDIFSGNSGDEIRFGGKKGIWVTLWLHHYWGMLLAVVVAILLIAASYWFIIHWSAEHSYQKVLFPKFRLLYLVLIALGFGSLFGQFFVKMVCNGILMSNLIGVVIVLIGGFAWLGYQRINARGGKQNVDN